MFHRMPSIVSLTVVVALSCSAQAEVSAEREALAKLLHELQLIETWIAQAEGEREKDTRIHFRYDWLRQDIASIKTGIQEHISAPHSEPRLFSPLRGDYRH